VRSREQFQVQKERGRWGMPVALERDAARKTRLRVARAQVLIVGLPFYG
jgi:hypothetical protein